MPAEPGSLSAMSANLQLLQQEAGQVVPRRRPGTRDGWGHHFQKSPDPYREDEDVECRGGWTAVVLILPPCPRLSPVSLSPAFGLLPFCHSLSLFFYSFNNCRDVAGVSCLHPLKWKLPGVCPVTGSHSYQPALILEHFHPLPKPRPVNSPSGIPPSNLQP